MPFNYQSPWVSEDIAVMREGVRRFIADEVTPNLGKWDAQGHIDRDLWLKAGEMGLLGADIAEEHGGVGGHFGHCAIIAEELARAGANALRICLSIHVIAIHYIVAYGTEAQKTRWLPGLCSGEIMAGVAMSEPVGGSDLQAGRTRAIRQDGEYVVNGSKIFITNGSTADLLLLAVKTDPAQRAHGTSMLLFDTKTPGFQVGRVLDKVGLHSSDTCELFFDECRLPADTLLGESEGRGFYQMMEQLAYERVIAAVGAIANMEAAFDMTRLYTADRQAFGKPIIEFQNTRFELADIKTTTLAARTFVDLAIQRMIDGTIDSELASMTKYWLTEKLCETVDRCVQLFGGYGYMTEYPIARLYADSRIERIYGGTTEIMKEIIGRSL